MKIIYSNFLEKLEYPYIMTNYSSRVGLVRPSILLIRKKYYMILNNYKIKLRPMDKKLEIALLEY